MDFIKEQIKESTGRTKSAKTTVLVGDWLTHLPTIKSKKVRYLCEYLLDGRNLIGTNMN